MEAVELSNLKPNPFNPRLFFDKDKLSELANSISRYGLLNPISVRKTGNGHEIVEGHRRVEAAKSLGWNEIEAAVKDLSDEDMLDISIAENLQREDLSKVELAVCLQRYVDMGLTQQQIADRIDKTQGFVSQVLQTLELPEEVRNAIITRVITDSHGRELLSFQSWYSKAAVTEGLAGYTTRYFCGVSVIKQWSVRELSEYLNSLRAGVEKKNSLAFWFGVDPKCGIRPSHLGLKMLGHMETVFSSDELDEFGTLLQAEITHWAWLCEDHLWIKWYGTATEWCGKCLVLRSFWKELTGSQEEAVVTA